MRSIRYIPGMLSLALLLPLVLWYLHKQRVFKKERCFNMMFLPETQYEDSLHQFLNEWYDLHATHATDSLPDYSCGGDLVTASDQLQGFRERMKDLQRAQDTTIWLHVRFTSDAKYATVMHAIETCRMTSDQWSLVGFDLVTRFYRKRPTPVPQAKTIGYQCLLHDDVVQVPPTNIEKAANAFESLFQRIGPVWPSIPIFLVLSIIGLTRGVRGARPYSR